MSSQRLFHSIHLGLAVLAATPVQADARDKIIWGWADFAPYSIPGGPDQGRGLLDEARALVMERLAGYEHEVVSAPIPRISAEIERGRNWCWFGPYQTPARDRFALFSLPVAIELPHQLIVHHERAEQFKRMPGLSLEALLARGQLAPMFTRGRSYGATIDALLLRHPPAPSQWHSSMMQPLVMLMSNRIDYTLEYPLVVNYHLRKSGQAGTLAGLPFVEGVGHEFRRVMCPKNDWGAQVIGEINAILRVERPSVRYRKTAEKWHDADGAKQIRQLYDTVFLPAD